MRQCMRTKSGVVAARTEQLQCRSAVNGYYGPPEPRASDQPAVLNINIPDNMDFNQRKPASLPPSTKILPVTTKSTTKYGASRRGHPPNGSRPRPLRRKALGSPPCATTRHVYLNRTIFSLCILTQF